MQSKVWEDFDLIVRKAAEGKSLWLIIQRFFTQNTPEDLLCCMEYLQPRNKKAYDAIVEVIRSLPNKWPHRSVFLAKTEEIVSFSTIPNMSYSADPSEIALVETQQQSEELESESVTEFEALSDFAENPPETVFDYEAEAIEDPEVPEPPKSGSRLKKRTKK